MTDVTDATLELPVFSILETPRPVSEARISEARVVRQVKCNRKVQTTHTIFRYFVCTFVLIVGALVLIPVIATEILYTQNATEDASVYFSELP